MQPNALNLINVTIKLYAFQGRITATEALRASCKNDRDYVTILN